MRVPSSGLCVSQIFSILLCFLLLGSILLQHAEYVACREEKHQERRRGSPASQEEAPRGGCSSSRLRQGSPGIREGGGVVNILACHLSQGPTGIFYIKNDITKTPFLESHFSPSTEINPCKRCPDPYRNRF